MCVKDHGKGRKIFLSIAKPRLSPEYWSLMGLIWINVHYELQQFIQIIDSNLCSRCLNKIEASNLVESSYLIKWEDVVSL